MHEKLLIIADRITGSRNSPGKDISEVCQGIAWDTLRKALPVIDFIYRNQRVYTVNEAANLLGRAKNLNCGEHETGELPKQLLTAEDDQEGESAVLEKAADSLFSLIKMVDIKKL